MLTQEQKDIVKIGNDPYFNDIIEKLTLNKKLNDKDKTFILSCAIIFAKEYNKNTELLSYLDLAYYIILKYSLNTQDYKPLYDFSINYGYFPITRTILNNNLVKVRTLTDAIIAPRLNEFNHVDGYIETLKQFNTRKTFISDTSLEKCYIAPTSFGKSAVIIEYIRSLNNTHSLKIVIIVPTKSLLMQTHIMIQEAKLPYKVIIHDEMLEVNDQSFIAIFTQERALRLAKKGTIFDVLIIDEAHKIFENKRGLLISRLIKINRLQNPNQKIVYLSPIVNEVENLKVNLEQKISKHFINFNLKEPEYFEFNVKSKETFKYNRFVNKHYNLDSVKLSNRYFYIEKNSGDKNFIYENGPRGVELLAKEFCKSGALKKITSNKKVDELKNILRNVIHEDYLAIQYLDYGLIYIHGKLPEILKSYLEYKFKTIPEIKYLVANSVILEGINLPFDTLYICEAKNISNERSLLNLVGRVNRLDSIFKGYEKNNLTKLLPSIHIINEKGSEHDSKFKYLRSRLFQDVIKNPTLPIYDINKDGPPKSKAAEKMRKRFIERIELMQMHEEYIYKQLSSNKDIIKKYFIENSINLYYDNIDSIVDYFLDTSNDILNNKLTSWDSLNLMEKISYIFIPDKNNVIDFEFKRMSSLATQSYYEGYYRMASKQSLRKNINWQVKKFYEIASNTNAKNKSVYVGESFGDTTWISENWGESNRKVYFNLAGKSKKELVNIALVKLQIEEDFVSFTLNKFIMTLYDFKLIHEDEYNFYIYGTNDTNKISLFKQGLNLTVITRLQDDNQFNNIYVDNHNNLCGNDIFKKYLSSVDDFYAYELNRYIYTPR